MYFSSSHITIYLFVCLFVFAPNQKVNCLFYEQIRFWKKFRFFFFFTIPWLRLLILNYFLILQSLHFKFIILTELFSIAEFTFRNYYFFLNYFLRLLSLHFAIIIIFRIIFWDWWVYISQLLFFSNYFLILQSLHFAIIIFFLRRDKKYILRINSKLWEQSRSNLRIRSCTKLNLVFW